MFRNSLKMLLTGGKSNRKNRNSSSEERRCSESLTDARNVGPGRATGLRDGRTLGRAFVECLSCDETPRPLLTRCAEGASCISRFLPN
ncbi:hypothetical protein DPEC_G00359280 [Dallia pectoralis]|uniref:Uncharacterized protein n=1 Tax=Dallia pectoralis TaxID=75939 RepID=A0ACC2F0K9_DALPE|nr:hypothetical protein DPEC_G00359280 [Dallia pectoralis]